MLRKIRIFIAVVMLVCITMLFLDFTGTVSLGFGWMAKIQLLPALLALNLIIVAALLILTFVFGRIYCSVICPFGIMQDVISWLSSKRKKHHHRFSYSLEKKWLRYLIFVLFVVALVAGINSFVALLAPYSSYGRIVHNLLSPLYLLVNNGLAVLAEKTGSYAFYSVEPSVFVLSAFIVAAVTFIAVSILAWKNGRTYCNTICPVGTFLSFFSRYSLFRIEVDLDKCERCHKCERFCKAACLDSKNQKIDYSRCVDCFDCISACNKQKAISYKIKTFKTKKEERVGDSVEEEKINSSCTVQNKNINVQRRNFLIATGSLLSLAVADAQKKTDGGLAIIKEKKVPERKVKITPPGALSAEHMAQHCTACQLCVSQCPNNVLRPSSDLATLMQPEMSYEKGYCRPECTRCSEVCPTNAITKITKEEKSSIQIGHAVWIKKNCVVVTDSVSCGNCAKHCPVGAIHMIPLPIDELKNSDIEASQNEDPNQAPPIPQMIPVVNSEMCIGCGTCENLCPARPFSAIYVEGHEKHKEV
jgi:polyferredoxin